MTEGVFANGGPKSGALAHAVNLKLAAGARVDRPQFGIEDFQIPVTGSTAFSQAISSYLNKGDLAAMQRFVSNSPLPGKQSIVVEMKDCSSSMSLYAQPISEGERVIKGQIEQIGRGHSSIYQVGFSSIFTPILDGPQDLQDRRGFTAQDLRITKQGGMLSGGSQISDAFVAGVGIAIAHRQNGFAEKISVNLLTDGWNRNGYLARRTEVDPLYPEKPTHQDWENFSLSRARDAIAQGRAANVEFFIHGFVEDTHGAVKLLKLATAIGLKQNEISVHVLEKEDPAASVMHTMRGHGDSMFYKRPKS